MSNSSDPNIDLGLASKRRSKPVVTRIAPSPTGDPHVGTAYVGLFNYALAKKLRGKFILRIEDTDRERYNAESEQRIIQMMHWLGLSPDESPEVGGANGPYRQSERLDIYKEYANVLFEQGALYASFMTDEELAELRLEQKRRKAPFLGYDGRERDIPLAEAKARIANGEPYVLRLRTPDEGETSFIDELRGKVSVPNAEIRDGVMIKKDGYPTYHFANVVDDYLMGVSHVMRAEEWVTSTPIHILLYRAFAWDEPLFIHLPLLRNPDKNKSKISKRKLNTSVDAYRELGILPEALLNFLANMGWSFPTGEEIFDIKDMQAVFDYTRISLGGPVFDLRKLHHFNAHYMRHVLPLEELAERVRPFIGDIIIDDEDYFLDVLDVMLERIETLSDFPQKAKYFFSSDFGYEDNARKKLQGGQAYLQDLETEFMQLDSYDYDSVNDMVRDYIQGKAVKMGEVMPPLRAALTGTLSSPDLIDVISVMGRKRVSKRLGKALTALTQGLLDDKPVKETDEATTKEKLAKKAQKAKQAKETSRA